MQITLYTIDCPQCLVLEKKLIAKGIKYITIRDTALMTKLGIDLVPILEVNGQKMGFAEAVRWINIQ